MKGLTITFTLIILSFVGHTQNIDSFLSVPQTLELKISTPQPRLKEKFQISLNINYVRAQIFKSTIGKLQLADEIDNIDGNKMILNVNALEKGKTEIGPLAFNLNGTSYTTNKLTYEIIEPLPTVDRGIWFRKVNISDSTFCIIIEQRIPARGKRTELTDNSFKLSTEPEYSELLKFKDSYSIIGLSGLDANTYTDFASIYDKNNEQKQFMFGYSVYYFTIVDKKAKIKITKDKFENIPTDYKFEDITIQ